VGYRARTYVARDVGNVVDRVHEDGDALHDVGGVILGEAAVAEEVEVERDKAPVGGEPGAVRRTRLGAACKQNTAASNTRQQQASKQAMTGLLEPRRRNRRQALRFCRVD
jgi:hypothetical protein